MCEFWLYLQVSVEAGAQAAGGNGIWVLLQILSVLEWILVMLIVVRISEWGRKLNPFWGISGIPSMNNKILYWMHVHRSLKMQLRLLSSDRDKIIYIYTCTYIYTIIYVCIYEPCYQFMRKNAEAFFAVDLKQKTNHRRENSFPSDIRILLVMVMLHRHACFRAVWFRSSPLIYQASLYLEAGPYCWLHVLVLKKSENHQQKIKIHNNVIKKTKEWRGSNKKLSVTLDHHQKLVFDECLRYFLMGSQQI